MKTIKLMADYDCFPLWKSSPGEVGNIDPEDLPISYDLKAYLPHGLICITQRLV